MNIFVQDQQVVAETEGVLFSCMQQGPVESLFQLRNAGTNTINYRFQQFDGNTWVDLDTLGTEVNNTLVASQVRHIKVTTSFPQLRLVGNASGGSMLEFSITRFHNRTSGGLVPVLNL
jgi:hypothetical protein